MSGELAELDSSPLEILLVEDDDDLRVSLTEVLEEEGYRVVAVASGTDAISLAARQLFDLVVTDIKTPGTDGLSALERVKEDQPEVAGIVITGYSTEEFALRAAKLKVENYLKKPFQLDDFLLTVDRLAQRKRREQAQIRRELAVLKELSRLASLLAVKGRERCPQEFEEAVRMKVGVDFSEFREAREIQALEFLVALQFAGAFSDPPPNGLLEILPSRVRALSSQRSARSRILNACENLSTPGQGAGEAQSGDLDEDGGAPLGSLLSVALLWESAKRWDEAEAAFRDVVQQSDDPAQRFLAAFGLARLARIKRRFEDLVEHCSTAVHEASLLGPLTRSQALLERGLLLSLADLAEAPVALEEALEAARAVKDTSGFALASLAREHFHGCSAPNRSKLMAYLCQPEHFSAASEASGWLLSLLLGVEQLESPGQRLLTKLLRSNPGSFEVYMLNHPQSAPLQRGIAHLDMLGLEAQDRVVHSLLARGEENLNKAVEAWRHGRRGEIRRNSVLRVFSFSGMRLFRDDQALEMKRKKPILLLMYLLCREGPAGEETILELFWPGDEAKGRASLRTALSYLRKLIYPEHPEDPFERQASGLALSSQVSVWFDFREFGQLVRRGRELAQDNPQRALESFRAAVKLHRGPFLENVYEDWALQYREQSEQQFEESLMYLARTCLSGKQWAEAYEHSGRGLRKDPLSQPFCEVAMQALIEMGRTHEALELFERCSAALDRELQLEPSIEMLRCRELARLNL